MIDKKQIQHIAGLVKIQLTDSDIKKYQKQLGRILDYVSHLQKVKLGEIEPYQDSVDLENVFREDEVSALDSETNSKLLGQVPEKYGDFIKTKNPLK